ncbi:hypothetical protein [Nocardioides daphniae]|uniref:Uncharacterized protein n=1 Tax=Nocardioides daphniae TaxID=402297 RepID=A0A4P7UA96_9ACTN|nr:hypothetical protein [Nocardioides daphniae]QCC76574.1 hypothetical protein E2C04_03920 [Nocardioides daphniae]GGD14205.1 hypothetical protein GCM10007231_11470 [Nocardioides daphniae]
MRLTRLVAGVLSAALLGLAPVALASAPAHAASYTTVTEIGASRTLIEYKGSYKPYLEASVKTSEGSSVYYGNVELQANVAGAGFKTIRTVEASGYISFSDVVPAKNTTYRVLYKGGASSYDSYAASTSKSLTVKVARKVRASGNSRTFVVKGKVTPQFAKKKILIKVSKREKRGYKNFRTIKTNKKGQFKIKLPRRKGTWYYRFIVKGDKNYAANEFVMTARVY